MVGPDSRRPTIQLPKDSLRKINLGQSFAEYDKQLLKQDVFVKTPSIEAALDQSRSKCLFIGRRGTGKTALTYYITKTLKYSFTLYPQLVVPTSIEVEDKDLRDTRQRPFRSLMACIKRALYDESLSMLTKKSFLSFGNFPSQLTRERNLIEDHDFDQRLLKLLTDIFSFLKSGNERDWLKEVNRSKEIGAAYEELVNGKKLGGIILIDRIDEAWDGTDKAVLFLMGLLHASVEISSASERLRPLIFLRENIFERVRQIDNEFSRLETCVVSLDWTRELLLELVERRMNLPFHTKLPLGGGTWDYFFESSQSQSSRDLVFTYCQERPRDILTYCSFAVEAAQSHMRPKITLEDLQEARRRFSDSRLKDLGDEYSENYPQLQLVLSRFYGLGKEYTLTGITAFIKKLLVDQEIQKYCKAWIYMYTSPERFVEIMYNVGFFGIKDGDSVQFRSMGVKSSNPPLITPSTHAVIHPSYADALNLQSVVVGTLSEDVPLKDQGLVIDLPDAIPLETYYSKLSGMLEELATLPKGKPGATAFEDFVGDVIKLCFFRSLANVEAKVRNVGVTVIRDWIASNVAISGFWEIVRQRYDAVQVIWECKNYEDLQADDFQQASYYMTEAAGKFVVMAFRGDTSPHYYEHIQRVAREKDGLVLLLTESDLKVFMRQSLHGKMKESHIQSIYDKTLRLIS